MTRHTSLRRAWAFAATALIGTAAVGGGVLAPQAAAPASAVAGAACEVTGGTLTWGVKESFRSYISSSIANGEWKVSKGASYETPAFTFTNATGEIDPSTGAGSVSFAGTVRFTGHDGVLNLTLANPTIKFTGDGTAQLLLDTTSNDAQGELTIDEEQAAVGKITEVPAISAGEQTAWEIADAPATLTAEGAKAFSGFYATGDPLDPISVSLAFASCTGVETAPPVATPDAQDPATGDETAPAEAATIPWIPIALGGAALVVIAVASTLLITGRKKPGAAPTQDPAPEQLGE